MDMNIHGASDMTIRRWSPDNDNALSIESKTKPWPHVNVAGSADRMADSITLFGLPKHITTAMQWALRFDRETDADHAEELAERIAQVISDTHDIDVTDDAYGVAVACDLLGLDTDVVYAARRAKKGDAA